MKLSLRGSYQRQWEPRGASNALQYLGQPEGPSRRIPSPVWDRSILRVGIHGGPVVPGECGDRKQEIVYFGHTVNTAARQQQACKNKDTHLLIAKELLDLTSLGEAYLAPPWESYSYVAATRS